MSSSAFGTLNEAQLKAVQSLGWTVNQYLQINEPYQSFLKGTNKIVSMMHAMWQHLLDNGGGYTLEVSHSMMGVHPSNRDGEGLAVDRVHKTPLKIKTAGFVNRIADADTYCFEDNPLTNSIGKFTQQITSMSPMFGQYKASQVKFGSVGAGHLNNSCQAADQQVECNIPEISVNGRMSKEKIVEGDPEYLKAWGRMTWKCIRHEVEVLFPVMPHLFQAALNSKDQVHDGAEYHLDFRMNRKRINQITLYGVNIRKV